MTFVTLGLFDPLLRTLASLNYRTPTPLQLQSIPAILHRRDLIATAQTGTGKTAGFALPVLQLLTTAGAPVRANSVRSLILVPTRELAKQVHQSVKTYGQTLPLRTLAVYGGVSINPQMMAMRKGVDVLVATPGRLLDLHRHNAVRFSQLQVLVLDEADRMLDLGFASELDELTAVLPKQRQTLLFSATFSERLEQLAVQISRDPLRIAVNTPNAAASTVQQWLVPVDRKRKTELFLHLLRDRQWGQVLAFVNTRKGADLLVQAIQATGTRVEAIHGDKRQPTRLRALERFKAGEIQVLVATGVAARGLDIDDLPLVVNIDLPVVPEDYIHRIGRTGRAGAAGEAVSLVSADEGPHLAAIESLIGELLTRREEASFEPDHRLPVTTVDGQIKKKPKKPKKARQATQPAHTAPAPATALNSRIHLGDWLEDEPSGARTPAASRSGSGKPASTRRPPRQ
ncbi:DEAD/DEAH box helicase [Pseudomonas sp. OIL-1]|uniref:DEAD/DEAH box helicase n=1 Tax=Pseudomonas sp. OIL-1 TaxID=2706126 RepID=UPI0013A72E6F|nr:DEAD/DEAH box helicase [Pseudomonas sp. OIL-1]QIB51967.1 DEAD/DEAH box helicase [Pseudomonas sp. OIL-1]